MLILRNEHDETSTAEKDDDEAELIDDEVSVSGKRLHHRYLFTDCHLYSEDNSYHINLLTL